MAWVFNFQGGGEVVLLRFCFLVPTDLSGDRSIQRVTLVLVGFIKIPPTPTLPPIILP